MLIYPAVDILGGKAVRLRQGDFATGSVYADDAVAAAERWVGEGARCLHVIDLDGAKAGKPVGIGQLRRICERVSVPVQYGGGLRSLEHLREALGAGAARVVLGTVAFADERLLDAALERFDDRVAVAIDVRRGYVATSGWLRQTRTRGADAVSELRRRGVSVFVYTNVDRDGMLSGVDPSEVKAISTLVGDDELLYSGGIGSLDDLRGLVDLRLPNLAGVIVGKALYEGRVTLGAAQRLAEESEVQESS